VALRLRLSPDVPLSRVVGVRYDAVQGSSRAVTGPSLVYVPPRLTVAAASASR
jgi:hypothetical protein